jgi:hypothetical protein
MLKKIVLELCHYECLKSSLNKYNIFVKIFVQINILPIDTVIDTVGATHSRLHIEIVRFLATLAGVLSTLSFSSSNLGIAIMLHLIASSGWTSGLIFDSERGKEDS